MEHLPLDGFTAEEALRFVQNARTGFAFVSPEGLFLRVNPAYCEILGCMGPMLVVGTPWAQWTHPDDLPADDKLAGKVRAGELSGYVMRKRYIPYGLTKWNARWGLLSVIGVWENGVFLGYDVQFIPVQQDRMISLANLSVCLAWVVENKAALVVVLTVAAAVISLLRGGTLAEFLRLLTAAPDGSSSTP